MEETKQNQPENTTAAPPETPAPSAAAPSTQPQSTGANPPTLPRNTSNTTPDNRVSPPIPDTTGTHQPGGAIGKVEDKLNEKPEDKTQEQIIPFDFDKLTPEQVQVLQAKLAAQPQKIKPGKRVKNIRLRKIEGKIVSGFKEARNDLIDDPENNRKVRRHVIPIKFFGEDTYQTMLYSDFINSEQVFCEVVGERRETDEIIRGEVVHRETGKLVEVVERKTLNWYTVKLPSGDTIEVEGRVANS